MVTAQASACFYRTCLRQDCHSSLLPWHSYMKTDTRAHTHGGVGKRKMTPGGATVSPTEAFRAFQHSATSMLGSSRGSSTVVREMAPYRPLAGASRTNSHFLHSNVGSHARTRPSAGVTLERSGDQKLALNSSASGSSGRKFAVIYCDTII